MNNQRKFAAAILTVLAALQGAHAATLRVEKWGEDTADCGSRNTPCETIQYALDQRAGARDRVLVGPGRYEEAVTIETNAGGELLAALRLESTAGMHATLINITAANQHGVLVAAPGVRVGRKGRGFTVEGATSPGYSAIEVELPGQPNVRVEGNRVLRSDRGIMVRGERPVIRYNVSEGIDTAGIACESCISAVIRDNVARNGDYGIVVVGSEKSVIQRNVSAHNTTSGFLISGIDERSRFQDNVAEFNTDNGFEIHDMGGNVLQRNIAFSNISNGFNLLQASFNETAVMRGNAAVANGTVGFVLDGFSGGRFEANTMTGNAVGAGLVPGAGMETFSRNDTFANQSGCGVINASGILLEYDRHYFGAASGPDGAVDLDGHDALCGPDPSAGSHATRVHNFQAKRASRL